MRVPPGYELTRIPGATVITTRRLTEFVRASIADAGSLYAFASRLSRASMQGRGPVHVIDAPGDTIAVRHYHRGGAMAPLLHDRYVRFGETRPVRELWLSTYARARGIRTPRVAVAAIYPAGVFYRADIATLFIHDSLTLADATFGPDRMADHERRLAWHAAGELVRTTARGGMIHTDFNLRNVLLARRHGELVPYLLDLDRCRIMRRVSPGDLQRMIARLRRSAARFAGAGGAALDDELAAFGEAAGA